MLWYDALDGSKPLALSSSNVLPPTETSHHTAQKKMNKRCIRLTDQTDHVLNHLDRNLPVGDFVQDLYSTDHADYAAPTRQHELDHQGYICPA